MPRIARIKKGEFCTYHIIQRGNERRNIFREAEDKHKYLEILGKMKEKYNFLIYAYCLMENHVHILINTNGSDISQIMKSIGISYVIYFNRKYKRSGHLFQDRFKSELVENERYLLEVSRYIHLNPVRANMIADAADFQWSSYSNYLGNRDINNLVGTRVILELFSGDISKARKEYIEYVSRDINYSYEKINNEFNEGLLEEEVSHINNVLEEKDIIIFIKNYAAENDIEVAELTKKKTLYIELRNNLIKSIRKNSNISLREMGKIFGGLSESSISKILTS